MSQWNPYSPPADADSRARFGGAEATEVPENIVELLRQTKPWVTFLSVLGFIGSALMILFGVIAIGAGLMGGKGQAAGMGFFYLLFSGLYIYPSMCLSRYGASIGRVLTGSGMDGLADALSHQKSFWRFAGIATIVMLVLYAFIIFIAILVGVGSVLR